MAGSKAGGLLAAGVLFMPNVLVGVAASVAVEDRGPVWACAAFVGFALVSLAPFVRWPALFALLAIVSPVAWWKSLLFVLGVMIAYHVTQAVAFALVGKRPERH